MGDWLVPQLRGQSVGRSCSTGLLRFGSPDGAGCRESPEPHSVVPPTLEGGQESGWWPPSRGCVSTFLGSLLQFPARVLSSTSRTVKRKEQAHFILEGTLALGSHGARLQDAPDPGTEGQRPFWREGGGADTSLLTIAILTSEQKTNPAIACPTPQRDWVDTIQLWGCSTQADFCGGAPEIQWALLGSPAQLWAELWGLSLSSSWGQTQARGAREFRPGRFLSAWLSPMPSLWVSGGAQGPRKWVPQS